MAIDFPASPTLNQTFTSGNVNYVWDGTKWTAAVSGGIALDQITEGNTKAEVIDTGSDGRFVVTTEGSERARVDSSGRLGIGTTSPAALLHIASSSVDPEIRLVRNPGAGNINSVKSDLYDLTFTSGRHLLFNAAGAERMRIANDGKMGFGTTTLTGSFNFDGSVFLFSQPSGAGNSTLKFNTSTGAVTYDTSSRLVKQNIEDCPYGLVELAQLKPRKYFRTDDQKIEIGFVADEVANVLPEFVPIGPKYIITKNEVDTEEIPLGVNYEKLTAVLTKALQETISEIESLKARVAALESPTTTLEIPVDPSSTDI